MATGGGGGGGRHRVAHGGGDARGGGHGRGGGDAGGARSAEGEVVSDFEEPLASMPPPMALRPESGDACSSAGKTGSEDPMSHYMYDGEQDSENWELYIQFDGVKFVHKTMQRSDIRYLNLVTIMEKEGYGICDSMYYVKEEGEGLNGLALVDGQAKVDEMVRKYDSSKKLVLTVMRDRKNQAIVLSPVKSKKSRKFVAKSFASVIDLESGDEEPIRDQFETQDSVFCEPLQTQEPVQFSTQNSVCFEAVQTQVNENFCSGQQEDTRSGNDSDSNDYAEEMRTEEDEELKRQLAERKRQRDDPMLHCEGETDVEDIFVRDDICEDIATEEPVKKRPKKQGPTLRAHSQVEIPDIPDWAPSDEEEAIGLIKEEDDDHYEPLSFVLPKGRKSRAKKQKERVWYDENRESPEQQFMLKLCFKDVYQFREALSRLHIVQVRNFHYHRNTPDSIIVWCLKREKTGCKFYMTASKIGQEKTFCIRKLQLKHTCPTDPSSSRVNTKWLSNAYVDKFRSDPNTVITTLVDKAKKDFGVELRKRMAYRVKTQARNIVLGDHKKQYHRIRDYLQTVIDKNPGSRCIVTTVTGPTEDQLEAMKRGENVDISYRPRFHGLFFCVNAARQGFLEGCRPFIGLDGCFIKLTTGAQILAATGRDGNNNIYPIAWAIVAKEDTANWLWFLEQLKYALGGESGKFGNYTIMSDRQKGLLKAVSTIFPNCPQRFCIRHIYANFQTAGFRGEDLKKCMDNAAYSWTRHGFDVAMEEMKKQCEQAWAWLSKIPVHTWARWAMDTNCKTDLIVNNLSETFNRYILDVRSKPVVTMLVGIYDRQMVRFDDKRDGARKANWEITPHYTEKLELMKLYSRPCIPKRAELGWWQVKSGPVTYEVNLGTRSCSCRKWDMTGLPCNHAVSAIYKAELHPEDFVSEFFKKPMYMNSYSPVFAPMPQEHGWTKTDTEDIMPPGFKDHQKGRRQEKRRKGKNEVPKPKETSRMATITCSNCKLQGHKYTSCIVPLRPDLAIRKNNHKSTRQMPDGPSYAQGEASATVPHRRSAEASASAPEYAPEQHRPGRFLSYLSAGANAGEGRAPDEPPLPNYASRPCNYDDM